VAEALDAYEADLRARSGDVANVERVRYCLPASLTGKTVSLLTARELRKWRDGMVARGLKPATADRTARSLKAALSLAAKFDPRITNARAWADGLSRLPDGERARNTILSEDQVRDLVVGAYGLSEAFGLFLETMAVTGQRQSQLFALEIADLQDGAAPRLMVPSSKKGRRRRVERRPVPIPAALAAKLRKAAAGKLASAPLFIDEDGGPLGPRWVATRFRDQLMPRLKLTGITPYALRHSSIVRQLLAGTPIRIVASLHDTSVVMIERNYSKHITDVSDVMVRRAMLDLSAPAGDTKIVPLPRGRG
jgi:integrase